MSQNRRLSQCVEQGFTVQETLDDRVPVNDGLIFVPGPLCMRSSANLVVNRITTGAYVLQRLATGAETYDIGVPLLGMTRYAASAGVKGLHLTEVVVYHSVGTANMTSFTGDIRLNDFTSYTNQSLGTINLSASLAAGSNYQSPFNFTSPQYLNVDDNSLVLDLAIAIPNTCLFQLWGVGFHVEHDYL